MIDKEAGEYLPEDFAFSRRWTDLGGEIWVDMQSRLDRYGPSTFKGDLSTQLVKLQEGEAAGAAMAVHLQTCGAKLISVRQRSCVWIARKLIPTSKIRYPLDNKRFEIAFLSLLIVSTKSIGRC